MEWNISPAPVPYEEALAVMEARAERIRTQEAGELVWLLEHPPLYTAGTSAQADDLLDSARFPVYRTGRGGQYTYHGPGQRIAYVMLDLRARGKMDVRQFVCTLEQWLINTLARLGVKGERREGRVGIWVVQPDGNEAKIAAMGIRVRRWVTYHGVALNVSPDLSHFSGIVPCGIREHGVTSLQALGITLPMSDIDRILRQEFEALFDHYHSQESRVADTGTACCDEGDSRCSI